MAELQQRILNLLAERGAFESSALAAELGIDHQKVIGVVKSLSAKDNVITCEQKENKRLVLTKEGEIVVENGSHEAVLYQKIPSDGIKKEELLSLVSYGDVGFKKAMANGWIRICKTDMKVFKNVDSIDDHVQKICQMIKNLQMDGVSEQQKNDFNKRKLTAYEKIVSYLVKKGSKFTTEVEKKEVELTVDMLNKGTWKDQKFRCYNLNANGLLPSGGHLHPLLKVRTQFRQIFLEMGFTEMPTNNFVESSFWNFDALFQPQQHPARDAHDTFFISEPKLAQEFPMDYLNRVKEVHSVGGYGSQGYKYDWKLEEAAKNLLRTHTTGVSARMLYQLAQQEKFTPAKYFSIDRVFRNETLDATHLAEFHQVEGLVADYGLTLGNLMGYIEQFFKKYGMKKLRFKPAYNPYTEPSMEIFGYHEGHGKWVEIGNSGVFRPEMLLPMGLPKDVSVIAWGLSLERPTMIKYGIYNIRELFGPKVNLQKVYDNPLCRLDK